MSVKASLSILFLLTSILFLPVVKTSDAVQESPSLHRIGCWIQDIPNYPVDQFVDIMFKTPPYFAALEWVLSWIDQWAPGTGQRNYVIGVLNKVSSELPNVQILLMVAFDLNDESHWSLFQGFVNEVKTYSCVYSVGLDWEHCLGEETPVPKIDRAKNIVQGAGLPFISYYLYINGYNLIDGTNWPSWDGPDFEALLDQGTTPNVYGMDAGGASGSQEPTSEIPFPGTPPDNPEDVWLPYGGWNQESVNRVMDHAMGTLGGPKPEGTRRFIIYVVGTSYNVHTGVSGRTGNLPFWDVPIWRQMIWNRQQLYADKIITAISPAVSYRLNLRVKDWDLTDSIQGAYVYMNNGTQHVKVSDSNGWSNWTGVSGWVQIKVKYYGFWVNGTFSVNVNSDKTIDVRCKLYDVTVTVKPHNEQGVITTVNVTVFNSTSLLSNKIRSGITANWTGAVTLKNLPNNTLTFTVYAKSDYSIVIANTTQLISSDDQSFNIVANQNYGSVGITWEIIVYVGLILSQSRKVKRKRELKLL